MYAVFDDILKKLALNEEGMFNKKELTDIHERLSTIEKNQTTQLADLKNHTEHLITTLQNELKTIKDKNFYYFEEFERSINAFRDLNLKYQKSFDELNLLKNDLTEKTLLKIEKDVKTVLDDHLGKMHTNQTHFDDLKTNLETLKNEIQRLTLLSHHIKQTDFELTNYLQKFQNEQNEKGKLARDVDNLQNLIGRMRRGQHS